MRARARTARALLGVLDPETRAVGGQRAYRAARLARVAHAAAVEDQPVREHGPALARHDRHERELDLDRVGLARQRESMREPADVRVDDEPGNSERVPEDDVRGLAPDA